MTDVKKAKKRRMAGNYLLFLGPTLFLFFALEILPLIMGIGYSFTDWNGIAESAHFVGLKNYIKLFTTDTRYWNSMLFTFKNTLVVVVFSNLIGFWLAYGLAKKVPFRNFMRAAFYLPRLIGGVILGFVWQFIFLNIFPFLGEKLGWGIFNLNWLGTPSTAFWGLAIVQIWGMAGYMMIIYVAGLTTIPSDYLEAAIIDGATARQQLTKIVLPLLMPSMLFWRVVFPLIKPAVMTFSIINIFWYWNDYLMTQMMLTRPALRTIQLSMQTLFNEAFYAWDTALAALTLSLIPMLIVFTLLQKNVLEGISAGAVKG